MFSCFLSDVLQLLCHNSWWFMEFSDGQRSLLEAKVTGKCSCCSLVSWVSCVASWLCLNRTGRSEHWWSVVVYTASTWALDIQEEEVFMPGAEKAGYNCPHLRQWWINELQSQSVGFQISKNQQKNQTYYQFLHIFSDTIYQHGCVLGLRAHWGVRWSSRKIV